MGESESDVGRDRLAEKWNELATKDGQTIGKNVWVLLYLLSGDWAVERLLVAVSPLLQQLLEMSLKSDILFQSNVANWIWSVSLWERPIQWHQVDRNSNGKLKRSKKTKKQSDTQWGFSDRQLLRVGHHQSLQCSSQMLLGSKECTTMAKYSNF